MLGTKGDLGAEPKIVILLDRVGLVVERSEINVADPAADEDPHALDGNGIPVAVQRDAEDQLGIIADLQIVPLRARQCSADGVGSRSAV